MENKRIPDSELILNEDGSIYHLKLLPEQIAKTIITVGDPNRVEAISKHFDQIEHKVYNREFVTHTGKLGDKRLTVISTGIGTDNIDIVLNELDALVNIDLTTREIHKKHTPLTFIRIGTSGSLQKNIPVDSFVATRFSIGLDGLMHFYELENSQEEKDLLFAFKNHYSTINFPKPYLLSGSSSLLEKLGNDMISGMTATCTGFYGPQGRQLRAKLKQSNLIQILNDFEYKALNITNFEMETAGIYGLSKVLGHEALSISAILANRMTNEFSKQPKKIVEQLINNVLDKI